MRGVTFTYTSYEIEGTVITFSYQIETDERVFDLKETLVFPFVIAETVDTRKIMRALHILLGISYYKSFIPPVIKHPYYMTATEAEFWNIVWKHGLGEFMHTNNLTYDQIARFTEQDGLKIDGDSSLRLESKAFIGIGGGKDSIVAGEILKKIGLPIQGFVMSTGDKVGQAADVSETMGIALDVVKRRLDPQIFEINEIPGSYNGHIPISVAFGLVGTLLAICNSAKYVVVANEASSSIPTTLSSNGAVNHQWSKSLEFERLFQDYLRAYVHKELTYFSAIRPLTSIAVAKLFTDLSTDYDEVFTSDNRVFAIKDEDREHPRWGLKSPKSLSSYILMSAWMDKERLLKIFGRDFLDSQEQEVIAQFDSMLGIAGEATFDCVGTPDELKTSLQLAFIRGEHNNSYLMRYAEDSGIVNNTPKDIDMYLKLDESSFPAELSDIISEYLVSVLEGK